MPFLPTLAAASSHWDCVERSVVVGVSGGADSVALSARTHALASESSIELYAAHLNHGLRPGSAEEDAEWTRQLCDRLQIPVVLEQADVPNRAAAEGWNVEEAAQSSVMSSLNGRPALWEAPTLPWRTTRTIGSKRCCTICCAGPAWRGFAG